ncbi:hypothetical protein [Sinosporangium siamense]|nr:hypothetical protein [Sinosporangium siamense]
METPPNRLIVGGVAYGKVRRLIRDREAEHADWEELSREGD